MMDRIMRRRDKNKEPKVLKARDIPALAHYIKSNECKNIAIMLGAGVSTAAGIPDFRSPKTGLYSNLARLNLPHPEAVFDISFFRNNPVPFYSLAHELYPGKFRPTLTHSFVRLLSEKNLLLKCFTQNIDTLERRAGVPGNKIIEAHGSFATQRCIDCKSEYDDERMKKHVLEKKIPRCDRCKGLIKPDIVFFGEALPAEFIQSIGLLNSADLLIVMGTSLTVHPFASLAEMTPSSCPRVLINLDKVGDFGDQPDDVILLGQCDEVVKQLCQELGWEKELSRLWEKTAYSMEVEEGEEAGVVAAHPSTLDEEADKIQAEINAISESIEESLKINEPEADDESSPEDIDEERLKEALADAVPRAPIVMPSGATEPPASPEIQRKG
ncbi:Sir2 family histone deacetylase Hst2 [Ephemerocybe angulata]|uniref:NAD-dependent protein deacetylase n=1 Tax=Ephemerocybe angulata TaxID=980116 RepID=A0A8H6M6L8_9AGAR|nr:Sir2 family histone deacetylase Hst2 [Tulosesus angulatus]